MIKIVDITQIGVILLLLAIWNILLLPTIINFADGNSIWAEIVFLSIYLALIYHFVLKKSIRYNWKELTIILLAFFSFDIISPPILIPQNEAQASSLQILPTASKMSSDYLIFQLLPNFLPTEIKYYTTLIIVPGILLIIALWLAKGQTRMILEQA